MGGFCIVGGKVGNQTIQHFLFLQGIPQRLQSGSYPAKSTWGNRTLNSTRQYSKTSLFSPSVDTKGWQENIQKLATMQWLGFAPNRYSENQWHHGIEPCLNSSYALTSVYLFRHIATIKQKRNLYAWSPLDQMDPLGLEPRT